MLKNVALAISFISVRLFFDGSIFGRLFNRSYQIPKVHPSRGINKETVAADSVKNNNSGEIRKYLTRSR